jgi:sRNA-binding protein
MANARKPLEALRRQLNGDVPAGLSELEDEHLEHLAHALHEARRRQDQALAQAGERAFSHIPRLLRGPIRRIVR